VLDLISEIVYCKIMDNTGENGMQWDEDDHVEYVSLRDVASAAARDAAFSHLDIDLQDAMSGSTNIPGDTHDKSN